jgi:paraquat-inducible protein B
MDFLNLIWVTPIVALLVYVVFFCGRAKDEGSDVFI